MQKYEYILGKFDKKQEGNGFFDIDSITNVLGRNIQQSESLSPEGSDKFNYDRKRLVI